MNRNTALFLNKFTTFMVLLNTYVASFPSHEKFALTQEIRNKSYSILNYFTETSLRKNKTTALNNLNIAHEQLRSYIGMAKGLHGRTEMIEYAESINPTLRILIDD